MLKPHSVNLELKLRFAVDQDRSLRRVQNVVWTWGDFITRLSRSDQDKLTLAQFKDLPKDRQSKRKNNGYFVGAQFKRSIRDKKTMAERQLITFDIDQGTPELLRELREGTSGLGNTEYVVYSTRTHGDGAIKLRVVIPLSKLLPHEWFQALARILAWQLDYKMVAVDVVSFVETQIMYWPAHCADIKPVFFHHAGEMMNVERTLDEWAGGDGWKDIGMLPKSPRERGLRENTSTKQNPLEKRGIVGAFCREYDIHEAIDKFLPEIYAPSEVGPDGVPARYTYVPGSMANGVQVYSDGHVQSFHGSDPAGGLNLNSFDLVRIHLHGELDGVAEKDDDPRKARSYKAMERMLVDDEATMRELREGNYGLSPEDVDDTFDGETVEGEVSEVTSEEIPDSVFEVTDEPVAKAEESDWRDKLHMTEKGTIKISMANLILILRHAPGFKGRFAHNEFTHVDCLIRPLRFKSLGINYRIPSGEASTMLEAQHFAAIRHVLEAPRGQNKTGWGLRVSQADIHEAVLTVCQENSFHPVRDWLDGLSWDGVSRIDKLWIKGCHTPDTPYYRQTSRILLLAMVARIYEPGIKFDFMPVLVGAQGIRKSTFVMMLGGVMWSGETEGHFDDKKKFVEASLGFWVLENGEMTHFRRASDDDAIKFMLSGTVDTVRLSYRPDPQRIRRQFVMIGTTNATNFLRDKHRRIWAIVCKRQLDIDWLVDNREQLFAEAVHEYRHMERDRRTDFLALHLTAAVQAEFDERQDSHMLPNEAEVKAGVIREWLETPVPFGQSKSGWTMSDLADDAFSDEGETVLRSYTCAIELFERALGGDHNKYGQREAQMIGAAMRLLEPEWRSAPLATCGKYGRQRSYIRAVGRSDDDL